MVDPVRAVQQNYDIGSDWWLYFHTTNNQKVGPVHRLHLLFSYLLSARPPINTFPHFWFRLNKVHYKNDKHFLSSVFQILRENKGH